MKPKNMIILKIALISAMAILLTIFVNCGSSTTTGGTTDGTTGGTGSDNISCVADQDCISQKGQNWYCNGGVCMEGTTCVQNQDCQDPTQVCYIPQGSSSGSCIFDCSPQTPCTKPYICSESRCLQPQEDTPCYGTDPCSELLACVDNRCAKMCTTDIDCTTPKKCGPARFISGGNYRVCEYSQQLVECTTDSQCNTVQGEYCDLNTNPGQCKPSPCGSACPQGYVCNVLTTQCEPGGTTGAVKCNSNMDCAQGQECNLLNGTCQAQGGGGSGKCQSDLECTAPARCNLQTGMCEGGGGSGSGAAGSACTSKADCQPDMICGMLTKKCLETCSATKPCSDSAKQCKELMGTGFCI